MLRRTALVLVLVACATARSSPPATPAAAALAAAGIDPAAIRCRAEARYGVTTRAESEAGARELMAVVEPLLTGYAEDQLLELSERLRKVLFWRMVRAVIIEGENHNFGVVPLAGRSWVDAAGRTRPLLLFRTGVTPSPEAPGSCFRSLLEAGGVRHVVNLFDGSLPVADLVAAEERAARAAGATYRSLTDEGYGPWRDILRKGEGDPRAFAEAQAAVARIINDEILRPGGAAPRGNLHVHCGGGMHRTGMIVGVVERCLGRRPWEEVEADYLEHVAWRSPEEPGGREDGNLSFIRNFDCGLINQ